MPGDETQGDDSHRQPMEKSGTHPALTVLRRNRPCSHLDFGLPAYGTVRRPISVTEATCFVVLVTAVPAHSHTDKTLNASHRRRFLSLGTRDKRGQILPCGGDPTCTFSEGPAPWLLAATCTPRTPFPGTGPLPTAIFQEQTSYRIPRKTLKKRSSSGSTCKFPDRPQSTRLAKV